MGVSFVCASVTVMSVSNIQNIDLMAFMQENKNMSDIKFTFPEEDSSVDSSINAQKLVLACGSEVFKIQFYGSFKNEDTIKVTDASREAFKIFLDILYNKQMDFDSLKFELLAELFYLAEKYQMEDLKQVITLNIKGRKINPFNILTAINVAEEHRHMEEFSNAIQSICASFVLEKPFKTLEIISKVDPTTENENLSLLSRMLSKVLLENGVPSDQCKNCKHEPCLNGEYLTKENFVVDALITSGRKKKEEDEPEAIRRTLKLEEWNSTLHYTKDMKILRKSLKKVKLTFKCKQ